MSPHNRLPTVIGLEIALASPDRLDRDCLAGILCSFKCSLHCFRTCRETVSFLNEHSLGVVIADASLPDGTWKDLLGQLSQLADAPNMIVTSRLADERLWAEVLNVGGYDLLVAPYDRDEVVRIAAQAWLDWERKRAVRYQVATGASYSPFDLAGRVAVTEPRDQGGLLAFPPGDDSVLDKGAHGYQAKVSSR
jgi:DNA-binding NtrC family response regulator